MKVLTCSLIVTAIIFTLGCSTENPICSTNFCAIGEVFPRSELEEGQAFSEVDIDDSVIFATLVTGSRPVETVPTVEPTTARATTVQPANIVSKTTVAVIVANTVAGGKQFEGKVVEVAAVIRSVDADNEWLTLQTNDDNIAFFVSAYGDILEGTLKKTYTVGSTYTLQLYIEEQEPDAVLNQKNIWSYPVEDIVKTDVNTIIADTVASGKQFEGKIVEVTAIIKSIATDNDWLILQTNNNTATFWVNPYGDIIKGTFQKTFTVGSSYTMHLYIREQDSEIVTRVRSLLVKTV